MSKDSEYRWYHFEDMHSGEGLKVEPYEHIFIPAKSLENAVDYFKLRFGVDPEVLSCDFYYSIDSRDSFSQLSGYARGCDYENGMFVEKQPRVPITRQPEKLQSISEFALLRKDVLVIFTPDFLIDEVLSK